MLERRQTKGNLEHLHEKNFIYFSIRTYFFLFYIFTFQNIHFRLSILHYIKISIFLNFFNYFSFFIHNNHHPLSSFNLKICKERKKKKIICKVNSININLYNYCNNFTNLHNYCNNFTNLHIVNLTDVCDFIYIECVKVIPFLYFALFDAEMLLEPCYSFNFPLQC